MGCSTLHIKTEMECRVFLFDEEKGIAKSGTYFNLEVRKGEQDLLFVSTNDKTLRCKMIYNVEENDCDYRIILEKTQFKNLSIDEIKRLAEQGDALAQNYWGKCYYEGKVVEKNYGEAVYWYRKSAEQGNADAQYNLGLCYARGNGAKQDYTEAVRWYRKAAEQRIFAAAEQLGHMYRKGDGVDKDYTEAVKWYHCAGGSCEHMARELECELKEKIQKSSYYLFFDTETTGVPEDYNAPASDTENWPRLVQLGWILTDEDGLILNKGNEIVKPNGFEIPTDTSMVHGITTEKARQKGKPLKDVIELFLNDVKLAKYLVGHNISFDQQVVGAELYRLGLQDIVSNKHSICTMQSTIDYCKIPGHDGYKYPKLQELYYKLFGSNFEDAHDAMADITATKKCFFELKRIGVISPEEYEEELSTEATKEEIENGVKDEFDVIYSDDGKKLIKMDNFWNRHSIKSYEVKYGTEIICDNAFSCCWMDEISIPETVIAIGDKAFDGCPNLKKITIPKSVICIGYGAFRECGCLEKVIISDSVEKICGRAFEYCKNLQKIIIPNSVISLGWGAFRGCVNLQEITIPDSIKNVGDAPFFGCGKLNKINSSRFIIQEGLLIDNKKNTLIYCFSRTAKNIVIPDIITSIGGHSFAFCSSLEHITIPESVKRIGNAAFDYCRSLKQITIPYSVKRIDSFAFSSCESLLQIDILGPITSIGDSTFDGCKSLKQFTIPESVTEIGDNAFSLCKSLAQIVIPKSVKSIGRTVFKDCDSLQKIVLPSTITSIGYGAFNGCNTLQQIIIPEGSEEKIKEILPIKLCNKLCSVPEIFDFNNAEIVCSVKLNEFEKSEFKCQQNANGDYFLLCLPSFTGLENPLVAYASDGSGREPDFLNDSLIIYQNGDDFAAKFGIGNYEEIDD